MGRYKLKNKYMAAITDLSNIINKLTTTGSYEHLHWYKDNRVGNSAATVTVVGRLTSLWNYNGYPAGPNASTITGSGATILSRNSVGSLQYNSFPGGEEKWLLGGTVTGLNAGTLILYDRLLQQGNLDATLTASQSVGGTISRNTGGTGNQIYLEVYTIIGATGTTVRVEYTNQDGTSERLTALTTFGGTGYREVNRMIACPLQAGDTGVRSVQNVKLTASTITAGNFGVTLANPILIFPNAVAGGGTIRDLISGLPGVKSLASGSCLALMWYPATVAAPQLYGSLHFINN